MLIWLGWAGQGAGRGIYLGQWGWCNCCSRRMDGSGVTRGRKAGLLMAKAWKMRMCRVSVYGWSGVFLLVGLSLLSWVRSLAGHAVLWVSVIVCRKRKRKRRAEEWEGEMS